MRYPRLGYFPKLADVPAVVSQHVPKPPPGRLESCRAPVMKSALDVTWDDPVQSNAPWTA
ncbi:hypothetical protein [Nonomuraea sp. JJY05]|uniref:hypothetical protein n=1 Tax=Nonomuraea sp. JJY05 TaxID=3350255 RepID=UPI00373F5F48